MLLKTYFDGGNKADSSQYEILSLAAVSGTEEQWQRLDPPYHFLKNFILG